MCSWLQIMIDVAFWGVKPCLLTCLLIFNTVTISCYSCYWGFFFKSLIADTIKVFWSVYFYLYPFVNWIVHNGTYTSKSWPHDQGQTMMNIGLIVSSLVGSVEKPAIKSQPRSWSWRGRISVLASINQRSLVKINQENDFQNVRHIKFLVRLCDAKKVYTPGL